MSKPFKFKQFTIHQDRCAMKVGTDGVLLGAWTSMDHHPDSILDIGAGTGVIALQLAQRSTAETIDAIEIDGDAYEQCVSNFEIAPWSDRLFCYHAGLDELVEEMDEQYDLIVSNPPYFPPNQKSIQETNPQAMDDARKTARFYDSLPFEALLEGVSQLLSPSGRFSTIIPYDEEVGFIALAKKMQLFPKRITRVKGNPNSVIKRTLLEFHRQEAPPVIHSLIIETDRHEYTLDYKELTKDFYLKM